MWKIARIQCGNGNCFCVEDNGGAILIGTSELNTVAKFCLSARTKTSADRSDARACGPYPERCRHFKVGERPDRHAQSGLQADSGQHERALISAYTFGKDRARLSGKSFRGDNVKAFEPALYLNDEDTPDQYGRRRPSHFRGIRKVPLES